MSGLFNRQGDGLSQTIVNLGLEKVVRNSYEDRKKEVIGDKTVLVYADDIINSFRKYMIGGYTLTLYIEASKNMGLCINKEKTKLMISSRRNTDHSDLKVGNEY